MGPVAQLVFKTSAVVQPTARSVRLRRRSALLPRFAFAHARGSRFALAIGWLPGGALLRPLSVSGAAKPRRRRGARALAPRGHLRCKAIAATLRRMARSEQRRTQLLRGVLDLCLLAVMEEGPAYGYEMTKRLRARGLSIVGEGSIYPLLGRLEREGLVETYRAASNGGPPRKYYRASREGLRVLAAGVSEWQAARDAVDAVLSLVEAEVQT